MKYVYWTIGWLIIGIITAAVEGHRSRKTDQKRSDVDKGEPYTNGELGVIGLAWPIVWVCWIAVSLCRGYGWVIKKVIKFV